MAGQPEVDIFSLLVLTRQIRTLGVKTKTVKFVVWDKSVPSSETSNLWLLFIMSGMSAFSLLKLTVLFVNVAASRPCHL